MRIRPCGGWDLLRQLRPVLPAELSRWHSTRRRATLQIKADIREPGCRVRYAASAQRSGAGERMTGTVTGLLLWAGAAWGQALDGQLLRPSVDAERTIWTDDTLIAPEWYLLVRSAASYVREPVGGGQLDELYQIDVMAAGYRGPLRLGVGVPVVGRAIGDATGEQTGLGDARVDLRLTALDRRRDDMPAGLAVAGRVMLPTATVDAPLGSGGLSWEAALIADVAVGERLVVAGNVGTRGQPAAELDGVTWDDQLFLRAGAGVGLTRHTGLSVDLNSYLTYAAIGEGASRPTEVLGGGWWQVDAWRLRAGVGAGLGDALGAPTVRALVSVSYEPPRIDDDPDRDGILGSKDACPEQAEDVDGVEDDDGCPERTRVTVRASSPEGEPIAGVQWVAGELSGAGEDPLEVFGSVQRITVSAEGYVTRTVEARIENQAAQEVSVTLEHAVTAGRVLVTTKDEYGRPITGAQWRILTLAYGPVDADTPQAVSPGEHELRVSADGFRPTLIPVTVVRQELVEVEVVMPVSSAQLVGERIEIRDSVYFETDKAIIKPESYRLLTDVSEVLEDHPEILQLRIEGHTDSRADEAYNMDLSQRRAEAVRAFLIEKGVDPIRLVAVGYGEGMPLVPGENEAAWAKNRRVDFFVSRRSGED